MLNYCGGTKIRLIFFVVGCLLSTTTYSQALKIPFWHSLSGHLGKTIVLLSEKFNTQQSDYEIIPMYKGTYPELFTNFAAAYRANLHPPLVQIQEISTQSMLESMQLIIPIYQLMERFPIDGFSSSSFLKPLRTYYGDKEGRLFGMPFNSSSAVLYFNKTLFKKAGIKSAPKTWYDVESISKKLTQNGYSRCGFTTTFPSWINIESFTHWHGLSLAQSDKKGLLKLNYQLPALKFHLRQLDNWHKTNIYKYAGRDSNATALFTSGHCAMFLQSSGAFSSLKKEASFDVDVTSLPYWPQFRQKGFNGVIGGAALWVINNFDNKTYLGVSRFLAFLSKEKNQAYWQEQTGYFPVLAKPIKLTRSASYHLKASEVALSQVSNPTQLPSGLRLPHYSQIRLFNDEQIEAILAGLLSVDEALLQSSNYANKFLAISVEN